MTATQDAPPEARLEIGRDRRRKEDQRLITGRTRWTDNLTLPGMLHLAMVRSPHAHATIVSIDVAAAKEMTNVVDVLNDNPHPSEEEIRVGLEGNLCRCTGYHNIVKAVQQAAGAGATTGSSAGTTSGSTLGGEPV